jgi:hypothetical protein
MSINTVSLIKRPFKYHPREKEIFETWFEQNIRLDALNRVKLTSLHEAYQRYVVQYTGTVPLSKNKFSTLLKEHLANEIKQLKVRTYTKNRVSFQGLLIREATPHSLSLREIEDNGVDANKN